MPVNIILKQTHFYHKLLPLFKYEAMNYDWNKHYIYLSQKEFISEDKKEIVTLQNPEILSMSKPD